MVSRLNAVCSVSAYNNSNCFFLTLTVNDQLQAVGVNRRPWEWPIAAVEAQQIQMFAQQGTLISLVTFFTTCTLEQQDQDRDHAHAHTQARASNTDQGQESGRSTEHSTTLNGSTHACSSRKENHQSYSYAITSKQRPVTSAAGTGTSPAPGAV